MGASDLRSRPRAAVTTARGDRRQRGFFTTADTVEDLEALRIALKRQGLMLDGISYGIVRRPALRTRAPASGCSALILDGSCPPRA